MKWETKPNSLRHVATCMATILLFFFFDSYGQTCLKKLKFWPLFYKGIHTKYGPIFNDHWTTIHIPFILQTKWISVVHHVCNEHKWNTGECEHEELEGPPTENDKVIPYFKKNEPPFQNLQKIVLNYKWLESVKYYTRFRWVIYVLPNIPISKSLKLDILGY